MAEAADAEDSSWKGRAQNQKRQRDCSHQRSWFSFVNTEVS